MTTSEERNQSRQFFYSAWQKFNNNEPLHDIEKQIVSVIAKHPEYHEFINNPEKYIDKEFSPDRNETNPFMHFALHMSIEDIVNNNQPEGIRKLYQQVLDTTNDEHETAHHFMQMLAFEMHAMQIENRPYNERALIDGAEKLLEELQK